MSQITTGLRSLLSLPFVYTSFQYIMGARNMWQYLTHEVMQVKPANTVLDIGCGPADLFGYLPEHVVYWGFDISAEYIQKAKKKYGSRGNFVCKLLAETDLDTLPKFDIVVLAGVLHHLDDEMAHKIIAIAYSALKDGGQMVSVDPCFTSHQNPIAHYLISKDRGQNVRIESGYKMLPDKIFNSIQTQVVHRAWIPYTHCYMVCTK